MHSAQAPWSPARIRAISSRSASTEAMNALSGMTKFECRKKSAIQISNQRLHNEACFDSNQSRRPASKPLHSQVSEPHLRPASNLKDKKLSREDAEAQRIPFTRSLESTASDRATHSSSFLCVFAPWRESSCCGGVLHGPADSDKVQTIRRFGNDNGLRPPAVQ